MGSGKPLVAFKKALKSAQFTVVGTVLCNHSKRAIVRSKASLITHRRDLFRGEWLAGKSWGKKISGEVFSSSFLAIAVSWINESLLLKTFASLSFVNLSKQIIQRHCIAGAQDSLCSASSLQCQD